MLYLEKLSNGPHVASLIGDSSEVAFAIDGKVEYRFPRSNFFQTRERPGRGCCSVPQWTRPAMRLQETSRISTFEMTASRSRKESCRNAS